MKRYAWLLITTSALCLAGGYFPVQAVENNLGFSGALVSEPCDLDQNTSDITVDFGTIVEKSLYLHTRTASVPFTINLINCDTSLGMSVIFIFRGAESQSLPGTLSVNGSASGIAIGIETQKWGSIPFNQPTSAITLNDGSNRLVFNAYVVGEPEAINNKAITAGEFTAIATFEMNYQ